MFNFLLTLEHIVDIIIEFALPSSTTQFGLLLADFKYGDEYTGLLRLYKPDNGYGFCSSRKY